MRHDIVVTLLILCAAAAAVFFLRTNELQNMPEITKPVYTPTPTTSPTPSPLPQKVVLENTYHVFQTFNNCGPAAFSMMLSYFGIQESQLELGESLRPYQNPNGDNDDKSVTLSELSRKAEEYGLVAFHRPNGDIELLKHFIANGIPVLTRTWLKENEDIGHYRIVKGYDDSKKQLIQDDSLQGRNLSYGYEAFQNLWEKFNFEYLVLVPQEKKQVAEAILGENRVVETSWRIATQRAQERLNHDPQNVYTRCNLSIALYYIGNFKQSVIEFEKIQNMLPFRTLWYQREPIEAYFALGDYEKVFLLTDQILNNHNRAYSELYILRGRIYEKKGQRDLAEKEFEKAVFYNTNLREAHDALVSVREDR